MSGKPTTRLTKLGRTLDRDGQSVNPPVYRASTFVFGSLAAFDKASATPFDTPFYGRVGTPTSFAFEEAMADLEGAARAIAYPSGLAAIAAVLHAFVEAGDHVLMVDSVYGPSRRTCETSLRRLGVETSYFDPATGAEIADLIRPNTRLIFLESPGSGTFEVQDIPAITRIAREKGIWTALDATWATPLYLKPLALGVDVSIHAATKYITGHSDAMLGVASMTAEAEPHVRRATQALGYVAGSEEANLGLRGLRTLGVRLPRHDASARRIAGWLASRDEVSRVFHPALPGTAGHDCWARDFTGASGLFSFEFADISKPGFAAFVDGLEHFLVGFSWGGYESLALPVHTEQRSAPPWGSDRPVLRLHIGLEDPDDLIDDLSRGFDRAKTAS